MKLNIITSLLNRKIGSSMINVINDNIIETICYPKHLVINSQRIIHKALVFRTFTIDLDKDKFNDLDDILYAMDNVILQ